MRSLTGKLTLASLCSSLISVALMGLFARYLTNAAFGAYVQDRLADEVATVAATYYQQHGSFAGVTAVLPLPGDGSAFDGRPPPGDPGRDRPPPGDPGRDRPPPGDPGRDRPPQYNAYPAPNNNRASNAPSEKPFVVVDLQNIAVTSGRSYRMGSVVPANLVANGVPIVTTQAQRVGTVLMTDRSSAFDPREQDFLSRTNRALLAAMLGGGASALLIGVVLTRLLTRPIRALTTAIQGMQQGTLRQEVPVTSRDELGVLVQSFNRLSHDLDQATQARRQMTADIAHELRTPLSVLMGYIETMRDGTLPPTHERFQTMFGEANQLQRLIDDLRLLSLADAGELPLHPQLATPNELLTTVAASFAPQAAQQHVVVRVQTAAKLPTIAIDRERMLQVLGNLVSNALRYTPAGGTITLSATHTDAHTQLEVRDTGDGIAPDVLPFIFERLYRADQSRDASHGGSGLGLAISKAIVEAHGGSITATSATGSGTQIVIRMPAGKM